MAKYLKWISMIIALITMSIVLTTAVSAHEYTSHCGSNCECLETEMGKFCHPTWWFRNIGQRISPNAHGVLYDFEQACREAQMNWAGHYCMMK